MAAASGSAAASDAVAPDAAESCGCTNIAIMQLFHELKQQFPAVPDRVVSECISQNSHDKEACEAILRRENQGFLLPSYPSCLKMSSGSCEPESLLAARLQGLSLGGGCGADDQQQSPDSITASAPPHVHFVNQGAASAASAHFVQAKSREVLYEFSDELSSTSQTSVRRSENRWSSTQITNASSSGSSGSESATSHSAKIFQSGASAVIGGSQSFSSQVQETTSSAAYARPRPTTLNVGHVGQPPSTQTHSAPPSAAHFEPFQKQPSSAGDRNPAAGVPYTGSYQRTRHSDYLRGGSVNFTTGANAGSRGSSSSGQPPPKPPPQGTSRENIPTSVYSDHTVVNSYQVNVNCSVRGGGSSSVNVTGSSSHTLVKTPEAGPAAGAAAATATVRPTPPPRPPPPQPKPKPRQRSALTVEPVPHYARHNVWAGAQAPPPAPQPPASIAAPDAVASLAPPAAQQPRSYTSVNLTLRPPSSEPQAPIDIQSAGTSLMYSTSSYDPRQGFQSKLQICIGPGGVGSVSAMRTRAQEPAAWGAASPRPLGAGVLAPVPGAAPQTPPTPTTPTTPARTPPPLPKLPPAVGPLFPLITGPVALPPTLTESTLDTSATSTQSDDLQRELLAIRSEHLQSSTRALLERQLERKTRLQRELRREKEKLRAMQRNVRGMEKDLAQRQLLKRSPAAALPQLSTLQKVQRLRQEIHLLTEECKKMTMEVDMSSDSRVPLGETDEEFYQNIYTGQQGSVATHSPRDSPHHREPPRQGSRQPPPRPPPPEIDPREGQSWTCTECTFRNYWELEYCEQCEMPRLMLGTGPRPAPGASCYCHPHLGKQLSPSVVSYPVFVPTPRLN